MPTYNFILNGWRGKYTATAPTEHAARVAINPYMPLYRDAMERAKKYEAKGVLKEATWYRHMAEIHAQDAKNFHAAAKIAPLAQPIPIARKAPPLMAIIVEETPKKRKTGNSQAKKGK